MNNDKYIEQLEEQNDELQKRLAEAESIIHCSSVRRSAIEVFNHERLPKHMDEVRRDTQNMFNTKPEEYMIELAEYEFYMELGKRFKELRPVIRKKVAIGVMEDLWFWDDELIK